MPATAKNRVWKRILFTDLRCIKHFHKSESYSSSLVELEKVLIDGCYEPLIKPSRCIILMYVFRSTNGSSSFSLWFWFIYAVIWDTASMKSLLSHSNMIRVFFALIALSSFIFCCLIDSSRSSCLYLCFFNFSSDESWILVGSPWIKRSMLFF